MLRMIAELSNACMQTTQEIIIKHLFYTIQNISNHIQYSLVAVMETSVIQSVSISTGVYFNISLAKHLVSM